MLEMKNSGKYVRSLGKHRHKGSRSWTTMKVKAEMNGAGS